MGYTLLGESIPRHLGFACHLTNITLARHSESAS